ncbi:MAG: hypothetical protein HY433_03210 [Candidatus Liptonbacteria bacterium]|nr:hypothetical protein [Candidatus Liptonbacteria bacterium]
MQKIFSRSGGYIALMSALIISAVMVIIVVTLSQVSFLSRINIADTYFKDKSRALAESCVNTALLDLVFNPSYSGNETITVASDTCKIISVVPSSTGRIISAQGVFANSFTNYKVTVASNTVSLISWEEVQTLP